MITIDDLKNCGALARETKNLQEQIVRLQALAEFGRLTGGMIGGKGAPLADNTGEGAAGITDLVNRARQQVAAYIQHVGFVEQAIGEVANPDYRDILRLRYMEGLTWEAVSERTHYSVDWLKKLHRRALDAILRPGQQDTKRHADVC